MLARLIAHALVPLFFVLAGSCGGEGGQVEGEPCGGLAARSCDPGLYCEYPDSSCAIADGAGTCKVEPLRCDREEPAVCGCDGERYGSVCQAIAAGVDSLAVGECPADAEAGQPSGSVDPADPA